MAAPSQPGAAACCLYPNRRGRHRAGWRKTIAKTTVHAAGNLADPNLPRDEDLSPPPAAVAQQQHSTKPIADERPPRASAIADRAPLRSTS